MDLASFHWNMATFLLFYNGLRIQMTHFVRKTWKLLSIFSAIVMANFPNDDLFQLGNGSCPDVTLSPSTSFDRKVLEACHRQKTSNYSK